MNDRYVLDSAGVRTLNATIARVRNLPGNPLNLNSRHRQVMTEATGGNNEYNGYFKIIDASTYNEDGTLSEAKIKIIDGATYDEETGTSGTSRCKVNNAYFDVPQAELAVTAQALNSGYAVFLHYNKNSSTAEETITLEFDETITEDSYNCYYQVGRVLSDNNENAGFSIQQDHVVGVPQMFLFGTCNQDSFVE